MTGFLLPKVLNCPVRSRGRWLGSFSREGDKGVISHPPLEGRAVEPVRNILEQFIGQFASPEWLKDVLQAKWRQIVGERLAKRTQVRQVKNGVVTIVASTPAIANDLQFLQRSGSSCARHWSALPSPCCPTLNQTEFGGFGSWARKCTGFHGSKSLTRKLSTRKSFRLPSTQAAKFIGRQ